MSSTTLVPSLDSDLLNFENAPTDATTDTTSDLSFTPDLSALSSLSVLGILGALSPSLADVVAELAADIPNLAGDITVTNGVFTSNLVLPDGSPLVGTVDVPTTISDLAALAADTNGTATLVDGILDVDLSTGEESLSIEGFDLATAASSLVLDAIQSVDTTVLLENGAFDINVDTALGSFVGTVDFAGGDLNVDLLTPFGELVGDIDFDETAVFPLFIPTTGGGFSVELDLNEGNVSASFGSFGSIEIPLTDISSLVTLTDGIATFNTDVPLLGSIETELEIGTLTSEYIAELIQDSLGTATITNGVIDATLENSLGTFDTSFDVVAFTEQGVDFFSQVNGSIAIADGDLTANLTTPLGAVNSTYDLTTIAGLLDVPLADIV